MGTVKMGLDLSINSTGVCVNIDDKKFIYYIVASKPTKKFLKAAENSNKLYIKTYTKPTVDKTTEYTVKENIKTTYMLEIISILEQIIKKHKPAVCSIEGISYGSSSTSNLADLAGLNFLVRSICLKHNCKLNIISPAANKKNATGMGNADKETMIKAFFTCQPDMTEFADFKIDDIADAFFLSQNT